VTQFEPSHDRTRRRIERRAAATYARAVTVRGIAAAAGVAAYLAFVAHAAARNQCPARELGACARVHALMTQAHVPAPPVLAAAPMSAPRASDAAVAPLRVARAGFR
jgi:hypothetical protein